MKSIAGRESRAVDIGEVDDITVGGFGPASQYLYESENAG
jgi:hypothetical protein